MKLKFFIASMVFSLIFFAQEASAQCAACVQDTTNCSGLTGAVCPDQLPAADNGYAYDQDVTFNMLPSFEIPMVGVGLEVTNVEIDLNGLPNGLNYTPVATQFDPNDNDPASQYGCFKICGIPCAGNGVYILQFVMTYTVSAAGFPLSLDVPFEIELQVNAPYQPLEIISNTKYLCPGKNALLAANDVHDTYLWSNNSTTNSIFVSTPGNYTLQVSDTINGNVCVLTSEVDVLDFNPNAGSAISICKGEISQLFATGADSFSWSPGSALSDSTAAEPAILSLDTTTVFTLTGYNDSCTATSQVVVTVDQNCPRTCQECIVDQNCTGQFGPAVCPSTLPTGTASQPYQTTFSFYIPYEFDIASMLPIPLPIPGLNNITVEYARIENLSNLPNGLTWESDQKATGDMYYPGLVEGVTGRGCISICGDIGCVNAGNYDIQVEVAMGVNGIPPSFQTLLNFLPQYNNGEFTIPFTVSMDVIYTNQLTINPSGTIDIDEGDSVTIVASTNGLTGHEWSTGETTTEITVSDAGYYTVTAFDGTCNQTVGIDVNVNPVNSIQELSLDNFNIFPNPTNSDFIVSWESESKVESLMIYDLQGKLLREVPVNNNVKRKTVSTVGLSSGLYFVVLTNGTNSVQKKLIKQ